LEKQAVLEKQPAFQDQISSEGASGGQALVGPGTIRARMLIKKNRKEPKVVSAA
jgi:hypothetical protein